MFIQERVPPTIIYLIKVSNRNTKNKCEIGSKLTIKTAEQLSTVFIVNWICFTPFSSVPVIVFEEVKVCCVPPYQFINTEITYF